MQLIVDVPDDGQWVVETAGEGHQFAERKVLRYLPDEAPPDLKVTAEGWVIVLFGSPGDKGCGVTLHDHRRADGPHD